MKSLSGKLIPVALIPVLITGMLPLTALSANAGQAPVFYLDREWDENDHTLNEMLRVTPRNAAELSRYTTKLEDGRWYYTCSDSDNTISHRITVHGNVSLILSDNTDLNIPKGIDIPEGSTLTIYGGNYGTGSMSIRAPQEYDAAIGGGNRSQRYRSRYRQIKKRYSLNSGQSLGKSRYKGKRLKKSRVFRAGKRVSQ